MRIAVVPGSFDPITKGHMDIILRAKDLFDKVIVLVVINTEKKPAFTPEERVIMIEKVTQGYDNIITDCFDGLLVDPCIPSQWDHFEVTRTWRGAVYQIAVDNPDHVEKGVVCVRCNGETVDGRIPPQPAGSINKIVVKMGLCL